MSSELRGVSSSERTLDAKQLAVMRPAKQNTPRPRKPRRQPVDRSLRFFCSNPQCDHQTWSERGQAVHMAREFDWAARALMKLAPDSNEALKLTGGIILRDLTDEECRAASAEHRVRSVNGEEIPGRIRIIVNEYQRRLRAGTIAPAVIEVQATCGEVPEGEEVYVTRYGRRCCGKCRWCKARKWRWSADGKAKRVAAERRRVARQRALSASR